MLLLLLSLALLGLAFREPAPRWGFFGHRRINRLAVFCLPPAMTPFFKKNLEYLTEHAVDPDKRRYATRHEAPRHFIDLDRYGAYPFPELPRSWNEALARYVEIMAVTTAGDTLVAIGPEVVTWTDTRLVPAADSVGLLPPAGIARKEYQAFFDQHVLPRYYEDSPEIDATALQQVLTSREPIAKAYFVDHFSEHGIAPYNLLQVYRRLTEAFYTRNATAILRLCAEIGHYVGDAHVPLHTTSNYNGQLTDQVGIHGFWESRIPELFADAEYDFLVGGAAYINDPKSYFWQIVLDSHLLVDSVLLVEKRLSKTFPPDQQYCYEDRLGVTIRTYCRSYAAAYQQALGGMVEKRMRQTVHSVACVWYSAWVDAGQPDLSKLVLPRNNREEIEQMKALNAALAKGRVQGRDHE